MAKGQMRSNREIRKPKQTKAEAKPELPFANRVKLSTVAASSREKRKG